MWGIDPVFALYFYSFMFSVAIGLILGRSSGRPMVGLMGFLGGILFFAVIDAFPIWLVALPIVIVMIVGAKFGESE